MADELGVAMAEPTYSIKKTRVTQHVAPEMDGGWGVRRGGEVESSRQFDTQKEAISYARKISREQGAALYIHREDGLVRKKFSYDSAPSTRRK